MNIDRSKSKLSTIALITVLAISAILVALPAATAQESAQTFSFINVMPDVVGVNQQALIHYGISTPANWPQRGYHDLTIEVERPDGETEILGPFDTDLTGGAGRIYVPNMVGTYRLRTNFPAQPLEAATYGFPAGTIFEASTSEWFELTVQEGSALEYPGHSLPAEYWSRPINAQFWEWSSLAGSNLEYVRGTSASPHSIIRPYNDDAPETGHILWAEPLIGGAFSPLGGGLSGGATGDYAVEDGDAYEGFFTPPVIMGGVLYFNRFKADGGANVEQEVVAVDLRTGEELWVRNWDNRRLDFAQAFFYTGFNYHAVFQYLWATGGSAFGGAGTTWHAYEPTTGRWVYTMENVPRGTMMRGPNGEIIIYTINLRQGWMTKWNSRWVVDAQRWIDVGEPDSTFGSWLRQYMGQTLDARVGIEWNVTIPTGLPATMMGVSRVRDGVIVGANFRRGQTTNSPVMWALSFDPGHDPSWEDIVWTETDYGTVPRKNHDPNVELMFNRTWTVPSANSILNIEDVSIEDDFFTVVWNDNPSIWGFRLSTGEELWGPFGPIHYQTNYSYESMNSWDIIYDGKYFAGGHGGTMHCIDIKTGKSLWNFTVTDTYNTYLFNNAWRYRIAFIADGKIYIEHTEHSPYDPKPRGAPFICIDIETGEEVWRLNLRGTEWGGLPIIGDSIIAMHNTFDQRVYAIGKGPSETTASIQNDVVLLGSSVMVKGTVTDISAGTEEYALRARFPKGVPAVSDESMSEWMEYVYMQKERPEDATGVEVTLEAIKPNGEYESLGTATTDTSGNYGFSFKPDVEGKYTLMATFYGSKSYYSSTTTTYLTVGPAAAEYAEVEAAPDYTPMLTGILVAVVIAIIIGLYSIVRKQK